VRKLAMRFPTAIVTGRCRDKVHFKLFDSVFFVILSGLLVLVLDY
jgi:hypothetical protein